MEITTADNIFKEELSFLNPDVNPKINRLIANTEEYRITSYKL